MKIAQLAIKYSFHFATRKQHIYMREQSFSMQCANLCFRYEPVLFNISLSEIDGNARRFFRMQSTN